MEEQEILPESQEPPPEFELEQPEDYSQYLLHSKSEILAVLRTLVQKGSMITVHFDQGHSFFLTSAIALSADNREMILDVGSNEEMNNRALRAKKLIFTTLIDKVKIQFSLPKLSQFRAAGGWPLSAPFRKDCCVCSVASFSDYRRRLPPRSRSMPNSGAPMAVPWR